MVAGKRSKSGHPLFVGGPQIGYFYPGLTLEMDLHGPGWNARGATSAPFPGYILIGRREDFVWSLTSAGADIIDIYVETLCEGSDTKYLYRGQCRDMSPFNAGTLDGQPVRFNRTVHGPVVGYATVDGRRVAVSRKRSSYLLDGVDLLIFQRLTRGKVRNARAFVKIAATSPQTFNTFYADSKQVANITTGRLPLRAAGRRRRPADRRAGASTSGAAFSRPRRNPQAILNRGVMNNWNNKPARGFPAGDDQWAYGSIGRVDLLNDNTAKVKKHTLATLTGAMNAAATQDVRAMKFVPVLARLLKGGTAPSARATRMLELLEEWRAKGGSRLDRDLDGKIDDPGAAILDTAWNRLADAAMTPVLGKPLADQLGSTLHSRYDLPPERPVRRLAHVHEQGPALADGRVRQGPVREPLLRSRGRERLPCRAVGGARVRRRGARGGSGRRPDRLAGGRDPRADRIRSWPAPVHDSLHEPAERDPAGHRVLRPPLITSAAGSRRTSRRA